MTIEAELPAEMAAWPARLEGVARGRLGAHALLLGLTLVSLFPVYWMFVTSLKPENEIFDTGLWPAHASLDNYRAVLTSIPILRMIGNTALVSIAAALAQVITGVLAGYALARWDFPGKKIAFGAIMLTWLVPFQVTMIPNYVLFSRLGLLDNLAGLILPHAAAAFAVILLYQAIRGFPRAVFEAAAIDGASDWRVLWEITLPNIRASLAALAILAFLATWNDYFWPLLLTRSIEGAVVQIGLQMFMTQEGNQWGPLMAASSLVSLPILFLYVVLQKQVVESFVRSGLR